MLHATICLSSFPMVSCVRVRVRVPEPHVSEHDPHSDHSTHPAVVVSCAVVISIMVVSDVSVVVSAPVEAS